MNPSRHLQPRLETLPEKKFVGKQVEMSFSDNRIFELWRSFMPLRHEIRHTVGTLLYSIEVYPPDFFASSQPNALFQKWAAVEVQEFEAVPAALDTLVSPAGLYAIFTHKGPASAAPATYQRIFGAWLPQAAFLLDERPHFAVMGEGYQPNDPEAEEEIWIPVKPKPYAI